MASIHTSVIPASLYGIAAVCAVVRDSAGYRPSVALAVERTLTAHAATDDAISQSEMSADLTLGRLALSPFALRSGDLELRPSATFEVGWIEASGRGAGLAQPGQDKGWWVAGGALAQGLLHVGTWEVEVGVGGQVPLTRYTFSFRTQTEVYRMRAVGFLGTVSIRVGLL
jgi:hypothetical protein